MKTQELVKQIEAMILKAAEAEMADDALKFSQAACNAANAIAQMQNVESGPRCVRMICPLRNPEGALRRSIVEVIWKFSLQITDRQTVTMPVGANILSVQDQAGGLQLWAIVNPDAEREQRVIEIVGTGNPMVDIEKEDLARFHIATVQVRGGALVWHVFELL